MDVILSVSRVMPNMTVDKLMDVFKEPYDMDMTIDIFFVQMIIEHGGGYIHVVSTIVYVG